MLPSMPNYQHTWRERELTAAAAGAGAGVIEDCARAMADVQAGLGVMQRFIEKYVPFNVYSSINTCHSTTVRQ